MNTVMQNFVINIKNLPNYGSYQAATYLCKYFAPYVLTNATFKFAKCTVLLAFIRMQLMKAGWQTWR